LLRRVEVRLRGSGGSQLPLPLNRPLAIKLEDQRACLLHGVRCASNRKVAAVGCLPDLRYRTSRGSRSVNMRPYYTPGWI
jgi:hypothetical protein